ncbi:MAG: NAD(P)/FAD-dependent oxidoreductase [Gammaproteobacteria bacterium]|nr:NAD(P)/FAD-dependent oxidoreductase [Gammaproteobacteria bacterium]
MTEKLDCTVIGAGVVGLAIGRALALSGREVVVLEKEQQIGMHASSRNSEVIHAGIYYPEGSFKARLCVQGKQMLYAYCAEHHVAHRRIGKLIVASNKDDFESLKQIHERAEKNGVSDLQFLNWREVRRLEPAVECIGALLSPSTGIVDTHVLMTAYQAEIESSGGAVVLNSAARNIRLAEGGFEFEVSGELFRSHTLINSAGLWAIELAASINERHSLNRVPQQYYAKGHYYAYEEKSPFRHLIYPIPSGGGLGIHATNDLAGSVRFGPDIIWVDSVDYGFDESRKSDFVAAIKRYFPDFDAAKLVPGYTGLRSKIVGPGQQAGDFSIQSEGDHGVPNLVNLYGIESPGLTSSLAIADYVEHLLNS